MKKTLWSKDNLTCHLALAKEDDLVHLKQLSDSTLGTNFYSKYELFNIITKYDENNFFFKLVHNKRIIGFIFFYVKPLKDVAIDLHCDMNRMCYLTTQKPLSSAGVIKSAAVHTDFQGKGLGYQMVENADNYMFSSGISSIWVPAWKKNDYTPEENTLLKLGYESYGIIKFLWHNQRNLLCPACRHQNCICDAVIFYKYSTNRFGSYNKRN